MSMVMRGTTSEQTALEHASRYEALRDDALHRDVSVPRHGLAVLLQEGVAAWMGAWSKLPAPSTQPARAGNPRPCSLPDGSSTEVVRVLADMTLGHLQEVYA